MLAAQAEYTEQPDMRQAMNENIETVGWALIALAYILAIIAVRLHRRATRNTHTRSVNVALLRIGGTIR
jgi:hypothetical protein